MWNLIVAALLLPVVISPVLAVRMLARRSPQIAAHRDLADVVACVLALTLLYFLVAPRFGPSPKWILFE